MKHSVILLNGPSSSGKSTLAAALQAHLQEERHEAYGIVSLDTYLRNSDAEGISAQDPIYEEDVYDALPMMCREALQFIQSGSHVIIDHVMTSERILLYMLDALVECTIHLVQVTCPLHELERREKLRGDRYITSAKASLDYLYPRDGYALTVDTHQMNTAQCVKAITTMVNGEIA